MAKSGIFERILLINIILILSFAAMFLVTAETSWTQDSLIEHTAHRYMTAKMDAPEGKGRITGRAINAPDFRVTVLTSNIQPVTTVGSEELQNGTRTYEALLEPGTYILAVDAEGYETLDIKDLEVLPGQDLVLDIKFSKKNT